MYSVNYHRAASVEDAANLLAANDEAKLVSGGMTLIPAMKTRLAAPSDLIDLRHIAALKGIAVSGSTVTIGAATTHAEVAGSHELAAVPSPSSLVASATRMCAIWERSAVRSPTTTRPPTIRPPFWPLGPRS